MTCTMKTIFNNQSTDEIANGTNKKKERKKEKNLQGDNGIVDCLAHAHARGCGSKLCDAWRHRAANTLEVGLIVLQRENPQLGENLE